MKAVVESHRDGTLELLWRLARDLAIPALAPRAALLRETARARLLAQQAGITLTLTLTLLALTLSLPLTLSLTLTLSRPAGRPCATAVRRRRRRTASS